MKFYDEVKPLYVETDASGVGLGTILLQTRVGKSCLRDGAPNNIIIRPIVFASKNLLTCRKKIQ